MRPCVAYTLNAVLLSWCLALAWYIFKDSGPKRLGTAAASAESPLLGSSSQQKLAIAQMSGLQRQLTERDGEVARLEVANKELRASFHGASLPALPQPLVVPGGAKVMHLRQPTGGLDSQTTDMLVMAQLASLQDQVAQVSVKPEINV